MVDRDRRRGTSAMLRQHFQRRVCRRQARPQRRRIELRVQRSRKRIPRRPLRRHPPAMRRKILRQLLRDQDVGGDVKFADEKSFVVPAHAGTHNHRLS
jgi:hypothetical protein